MLINRTIKESNEMLATTLRSIGDAVITTNLQGRITFMNRMAEMLTGCHVGEALGKKSFQVFQAAEETTGKPIPCPVLSVLDNKAPTGYLNHTILRSLDGTQRTIAYNATPIRDESGEMLGVVLVFHSSRPAHPLENEDRLQLIARATNDAVWDWDLNADKVWWNEAITTLFGYSQADVRSDIQWIVERIHPADREEVRSGLFGCQDDGRRYWQREYRFLCQDGSYSAVLERGYVLRDEQGRALRMIGTMMDITGRREAQEELLRINAELEHRIEERTAELRQANKELEAFTYSVSHDLRTPLRSIIASSRILQEENDLLDSESRETLSRLVASATRMAALIDDLLQYSRLCRSSLVLKQINLSEIASDVSKALRERLDSSPEVWIEPDIIVDADAGMVRVLLENLLDNAMKFASRASRPQIYVGSEIQHDERVFFVRDNGVGFEHSKADRLFQPFERLHSQSEFPGTGIGLSNCERIVHRHGGRIWAESQVGQGATFYFTLGPRILGE